MVLAHAATGLHPFKRRCTSSSAGGVDGSVAPSVMSEEEMNESTLSATIELPPRMKDSTDPFTSQMVVRLARSLPLPSLTHDHVIAQTT